jgi:AraC family transcriptional regulator
MFGEALASFAKPAIFVAIATGAATSIMKPPESSKYGSLLTTEAWSGLPLRVGAFLGSGCLEGLVAREDTVLLWSGGSSEVTIRARLAGRRAAGRPTLEFTRRGGMVDFIPRGTTLDDVRWRGETHGCISVSLERVRVEQMLGGHVAAFDAERGLRTNVTDGHIVDLVRRLESQAVQNEPWGALYVEGLSLTLASYVYGRHAAAPPPHASAQLPPSELEKLVVYVESHLGDGVALSDLARLVGYSPAHLARAFKTSFGVSPYQYVLRRRVERAKALLRDRSRSIAEVALACGFATQSHFTAAFKARTGDTPGAFRRG